MRPLHHLKLPALALLFTLLVVQLAALASEAQPIDVLRAHVSAGIAVLNNDGEDSAEDYTNQQQQLCANRPRNVRHLCVLTARAG